MHTNRIFSRTRLLVIGFIILGSTIANTLTAYCQQPRQSSWIVRFCNQRDDSQEPMPNPSSNTVPLADQCLFYYDQSVEIGTMNFEFLVNNDVFGDETLLIQLRRDAPEVNAAKVTFDFRIEHPFSRYFDEADNIWKFSNLPEEATADEKEGNFNLAISTVQASAHGAKTVRIEPAIRRYPDGTIGECQTETATFTATMAIRRAGIAEGIAARDVLQIYHSHEASLFGGETIIPESLVPSLFLNNDVAVDFQKGSGIARFRYRLCADARQGHTEHIEGSSYVSATSSLPEEDRATQVEALREHEGWDVWRTDRGIRTECFEWVTPGVQGWGYSTP